MKRLLALIAVAAGTLGIGTAPAALATTYAFTSSAQFGTYTAQGTDGNTYTWNNDAWCPTHGPQTINVNNNNDWNVTSQQTFNTDCYVQTYPHIGWAGGNNLSSYPAISGSDAETGPGYGGNLQWEAAYDMWLNNGSPGSDSGYEVMVWTDTSGVSPSGFIKNVTIDGVQYGWYQTQGGNGPASWFVQLTNTPTTTTNLKDVLSYVAANGGNYTGPADPAVDTIEFGWEVWGTGNVPVNFNMTQYSLNFTGSPPPPPTAGYVSMSKIPPLVLDDPNGSTQNGTAAQVWSSTTGTKANEQFQTGVASSHVVKLASDPNLCLDVKGQGSANGTPVIFYQCNGGQNQMWTPLSSGALEAVQATNSRHTPIVLDDPNGAGNGTKLQIWQANGRNQQVWSVP